MTSTQDIDHGEERRTGTHGTLDAGDSGDRVSTVESADFVARCVEVLRSARVPRMERDVLAGVEAGSSTPSNSDARLAPKE
jgi:hypothetical protein